MVSDHHHFGYASKLIDIAEDWLLEVGFHHVVITCLPSATEFYEKLGYAKTKAIDDAKSQLAYMEKDIH